MTEIVLTGINVFENRGTEALAISIVQGLQRTGAHVTVITRDMAGARASLGALNPGIVEDNAWAPKLTAPESVKRRFRQKRWFRQKILRQLHPYEAALAKADLVVVSGGDIFSSDYSIMERYLRQLDQPLAAGVPVMFFAQSIGPFATEAERQAFAATARRATSTVRETISEVYLTQTLGIDPARVTLTADPAFLLEVPEDLCAAMLAEYGLTAGTYAAAAVSRSISGFTDLTHEYHLAAWVEGARWLMEAAGHLVLVPHVQMPEAHQNDLSLAHEIHAALGQDPRCTVMDHRMHGSVEFKAVLSRAVFVTAERTHGAIGAMSSGVPTLSIGYSIKAEGVLRQLIRDEALVAKSLVPAPDFSADPVARLAAAWAVRKEFANALPSTLPGVKARAAENFAIAARLARSGAAAGGPKPS